MKNKVINVIKHDTEENWAKAINFIPQDGELIMYDGILQEGMYIQEPKFKIGDGKTLINNLPFISSLMGNKKSPVYENKVLTLF